MDIVNDFITTYQADRDRLVRLHGEHEVLATRLTDLKERAQTGAWDVLDEVWSDFARDLEAHMAFEERDLFGRLVTDHPEHSDYIAQLREEHETIRQDVERLGVEIQLHVVRAPTVDKLAKSLQEHAASEHRVFYPWLEDKLT